MPRSSLKKGNTKDDANMHTRILDIKKKATDVNPSVFANILPAVSGKNILDGSIPFIQYRSVQRSGDTNMQLDRRTVAPSYRSTIA